MKAKSLRCLLLWFVFSSGTLGPVNANEPIISGIRGSNLATDSSGQIYVINDSGVRIYDAGGDFLRQFGEPGMFNRPSALAVNSAGHTYVLDDSARVQVFDQQGAFLFSFGRYGTLPGQFRDPSDLAIDEADNVYVVDGGNKRLQIFDANGNRQDIISDVNFSPYHVALHDGDIYLSGSNQVRVYDSTRQQRFAFGPYEAVEAELYGDLFVNDLGVYVAYRNHVSKFGHDGQFQFRSLGHQWARGIAAGTKHDLLVLEDIGHFIRSVDESTIRHWDGRINTRQEKGPFRLFNYYTSWLGASSLSSSVESTAETFRVPGTAQEEVEMTFTFELDTGFYITEFAVYEPSDIDADPVEDRQAFAREVRLEGTLLFDEPNDQPRTTATFTAPAGTELAFALFGASHHGKGGNHFSQASANDQGLDQMLAFLGSDVTYFGFEDLALGRANEFGDFTDMFISVDVALVPVPEPSTLCTLWAMLIPAVVFRSKCQRL